LVRDGSGSESIKLMIALNALTPASKGAATESNGAGAEPHVSTSHSRAANIFALISLVVFALTTAALIRSFSARDLIGWQSDSHPLNVGAVRAGEFRIAANTSRGHVGFGLEKFDWPVDPHTKSRWSILTFRPAMSLIYEASPYDRSNIELAGFQWVHFATRNQMGSTVNYAVYALILPIWPLLIASGIPPWLWWRRRRKLGVRGFPVTADVNASSMSA